MSVINQRLLKILTEYYAHSREFRNAARQADDRTLLAARDHLAQRNRDQSKSAQIREIDSTYRYRFGQAAPATNVGGEGRGTRRGSPVPLHHLVRPHFFSDICINRWMTSCPALNSGEKECLCSPRSDS